jgi:polyphenol oxidase
LRPITSVADSSTTIQPNQADFQPLEVLQAPLGPNFAWLVHGFSTRTGGVSALDGAASTHGDLNLGFTPRDAQESVVENRDRFLRAVLTGNSASATGWGVVTLKQMHSGLVRRVGKSDATPEASQWGDGLITSEPGVLLGIQTADCLPILIADGKRKAIGAFHAGWRGTLKGIVARGVAAMQREFGSEPPDMRAAIGPGIGSCCFTVGTEVRELFSARYPYAQELYSDEGRMDLVEANRRQLLTAGLAPEAIFALNACTSCHTNQFFSYRAEHGKTGRMMAVIGVSPAG